MILLVVDTQTLITNDKLYMFDRFTENVKKLIAAARENSVEVIFIRHDDGEGQALTKGAEGYDICDEFKPLNGERIFDKTFNSAFLNTGLTEYLNGCGEKEIMAVGLQTEYCIDATIKSGFEHGFRMIVPEYCNRPLTTSLCLPKRAIIIIMNSSGKTATPIVFRSETRLKC